MKAAEIKTEIFQNCKRCGKTFSLLLTKKQISKNEYRKCCSEFCSHSRHQTDVTKKKIGESLTGRKSPRPPTGVRESTSIVRLCKEKDCDNIFKCSQKSTKLYCSKECGKKNLGGYREFSGHSRRGYYNGIYCGSTYELAWVIYNIDHGIYFERFSGILKGEGIKYIPDFKIGNCIFELKGIDLNGSVQKKTDLAISLGYDIKVLYKKDIQYMIDYVIEKYDIKNKTKLYVLYDEHVPTYKYICKICKKEYGSEKLKDNDNQFCSRKCSGKGNVVRRTLKMQVLNNDISK